MGKLSDMKGYRASTLSFLSFLSMSGFLILGKYLIHLLLSKYTYMTKSPFLTFNFHSVDRCC